MAIRPTRPARLVARLAVAGALALGLAGGVASAASAAPAPVVDPNPQVVPERPIRAIDVISPVTTTTVPKGPEVPDPRKPGPCDDKTGVDLPKECRIDRPDPCDPKQKSLPDRCKPDPCKVREGADRPERCRPEPCAVKGDGEESIRGARYLGRKDCPEPKGCSDPDTCDRPVPGKPTFTG